MELSKLKPYSFGTIAAVFELHLSHLMKYLHRMPFNEQDYLNHRVPLNFATLHRGALKITFKWSIIALLALSYRPNSFPALRGFTLTFEQTLNVQKIDFFIAIYQGAFVVCEYACLYSLGVQLKYQNTKLDVVYDLKSRLDKELSERSKMELIAYFVRYSYLAGLCNKLTAISLVALIVKLMLVVSQLYSTSHIDLSQLIIAVYMLLSVQLMFFQVMFIIFTLLTGMFFIIKIFRMKMTKCLLYVKSFRKLGTRALFGNFFREYIHLHKYVPKYNKTVKEYIFSLDIGSKFLTTFIIIYISKQPNVNIFMLFFAAFYIVAYLYDMFLHFKLAYFQIKNAVIYKCLVDYCGQNSARVSKSTNSNVYCPKENIDFQLKLNFMTEFVSNNQMGFTNGRQYVIDKYKVVEAFMLNIYILILLAKKLEI